MFGFGAFKDLKEPVAKQAVVIAGYIGKLPTHADFVSSNQRYREVTDVDQVLNGLYPELNQTNVDASFALVNFCRVGGGDRQTFMGAIHASHDSAQRQYPYMEFLRYTDPRLYYQPDFAMLAACQQMMPSFDRLGGSASRPFSIESLNDVSSELEKKVIKQDWLIILQQQLSTCTAKGMFIELVGADAAFWRKQMACCLLLMADFISNPHAKANFGIWLPIGSSEISHVISQFWLTLLKELTHKDWRPDLFWTRQLVGNRLYILCRPMTTTVLASIVSARQPTRFLGWGDVLTAAPAEKLSAIELFLAERYTDADWSTLTLLELSTDLITAIKPLMEKGDL